MKLSIAVLLIGLSTIGSVGAETKLRGLQEDLILDQGKFWNWLLCEKWAPWSTVSEDPKEDPCGFLSDSYKHFVPEGQIWLAGASKGCPLPDEEDFPKRVCTFKLKGAQKATVIIPVINGASSDYCDKKYAKDKMDLYAEGPEGDTWKVFPYAKLNGEPMGIKWLENTASEPLETCPDDTKACYMDCVNDLCYALSPCTLDGCADPICDCDCSKDEPDCTAYLDCNGIEDAPSFGYYATFEAEKGEEHTVLVGAYRNAIDGMFGEFCPGVQVTLKVK